MACGTPVVMSSAGSLSEVAGDAAILVDPTDVGGFVLAMKSILDDCGLREKLGRAGYERAQVFSWDAAVRRTADVYSSVAAHAALAAKK